MSMLVGAAPAPRRSDIADAFSRCGGTTLRTVPARIGAAFARWWATFVEARLRKAGLQVLRHLDERIQHANGVERTDLIVRANDLRRSLS
jgi:hypothetical protein